MISTVVRGCPHVEARKCLSGRELLDLRLFKFLGGKARAVAASSNMRNLLRSSTMSRMLSSEVAHPSRPVPLAVALSKGLGIRAWGLLVPPSDPRPVYTLPDGEPALNQTGGQP